MTRLDSNPNPKCHSDHRRAFTGRIVKIDRHRGYGFIAGPSRSHIFFHVNQLGIEKSEIAVGAMVSGTSVLGPKGYSLDQISTFASPQKILDDLTKPYLLKVCWYDEEKKYGFADLADNSIGPAIMFHIQHLKAHPRRNIIPELRFTATLTNQQGSGRFRVHEILHFDQP